MITFPHSAIAAPSTPATLIYPVRFTLAESMLNALILTWILHFQPGNGGSLKEPRIMRVSW